MNRGVRVCQKTYPAEGFGGKDSVKENRQGCLSCSIKPFFKLFKSLKNAGSLAKILFCQADPPADAGG